MDNIKKLWTEIYDKLTVKLSTPVLESWINKLIPICVKGNALVLLCHNGSTKRVIENTFTKDFKQSAQEIGSIITEFIFIEESERSLYSSEEITSQNVPLIANSFNRNYTFDSFIVGNSNQFVSAAARAVAENPGKLYNPLFMYGGVGLGKTHLMHAIGAYIMESQPEKKVLYITAENFVNELIYSIRHSSSIESTKNFRDKYRSLDVLLIDDIQFIIGKTSTQEALFHIFNDLYNAQKQIIISSDRPSYENTQIEERLTSRFTWGLIADIQSPSIETRIAILQRKAFEYHLNISGEVIKYIAEKNSSNIRALEGMLKTVVFYLKLNDNMGANQIELAKEALKDYETESQEKLSIDSIIGVVCAYFNVTKEMLEGKKRNKELVEPRQIAIYLITELLPEVPLASIGNALGGRDHTTIMHARDKITDMLSSLAFKKQIDELKKLVPR